MRKEKLIAALDDFEAAYIKLLSALQSADFDPNDYINEDYPFEASFDEIDISKWVESSILKLKENNTMKINEAKLREYVEEESILEFDTLQEYLDFVNEERHYFYINEYPNEFKTLEETKQLAVEYQLEYNGKVYWILFDECLDVYED